MYTKIYRQKNYTDIVGWIVVLIMLAISITWSINYLYKAETEYYAMKELKKKAEEEKINELILKAREEKESLKTAIEATEEVENNIIHEAKEISSRGNFNRRYTEYYMIVTAYSLDYESCGKYPWDDGYAVTASMKKIGEDIFPHEGIIAAPKEFPFGTIMEVEGWGTGTVYDRGSAIIFDEEKQMYRLDLFFETREQALEWGKRIVKVKIYK